MSDIVPAIPSGRADDLQRAMVAMCAACQVGGLHLDRKLERILGMLLKFQDLRRMITPDAAA